MTVNQAILLSELDIARRNILGISDILSSNEIIEGEVSFMLETTAKHAGERLMFIIEELKKSMNE